MLWASSSPIVKRVIMDLFIYLLDYTAFNRGSISSNRFGYELFESDDDRFYIYFFL